MKILVVSQLPPPVHGSTVMTRRFMEALSKRGIDAFIIERPFSRSQEEVENVSFAKLLKIPLLFFRLLKALLFYKPTLTIFFITVELRSFIIDCSLLFLLRLFNVDYVLYMHGKGLKRWGKESIFPIRFIANKILSASLGGIALGEKLKNDVNGYIPDERIKVIPNGIPDVAYHRWKNRTQNRPKELLTVLYLSNLIPDKGPMNFLKMAKRVLGEENEVRFIVAGPSESDEFTDSLMNYIKDEGLSDHVLMPGGVYGEEKNIIFENADIFVFPSYYSKEAFPLVNVEAIQWGLPVVSSDEGAVPEVVNDCLNGFIVNPKDIDGLTARVLTLIRDSDLRFRMGRIGREKFEQKYSLQAYERNVARALKYFKHLQG